MLRTVLFLALMLVGLVGAYFGIQAYFDFPPERMKLLGTIGAMTFGAFAFLMFMGRR